MKEIIKKQLLSCKNVHVDFSDDDLTIFIKKPQFLDYSMLELDHVYLIQVDASFFGENSTITLNWNHGNTIKSNVLKVSYIQKSGEMYRFDGVGYDIKTNTTSTDLYSGIWIPQKYFTILQEM